MWSDVLYRVYYHTNLLKIFYFFIKSINQIFKSEESKSENLILWSFDLSEVLNSLKSLKIWIKRVGQAGNILKRK